MSPGTFRKRKYLMPPMSPDRSSIQSSGYMIVCWSVGFGAGRVGVVAMTQYFVSSVGRLDGVEPGLEPVDVLARERERPLRDLRGAAGALDVRDGERLPDEQMAVADREGVAVERADRRAGSAVALG